MPAFEKVYYIDTHVYDEFLSMTPNDPLMTFDPIFLNTTDILPPKDQSIP